MELFQNTKHFPRENIEYLKYRSLFSRAPLLAGILYKTSSVQSLSSQQNSANQSHLPNISSQETDPTAPSRQIQSAPKIVVNTKLPRVENSSPMSADMYRKGNHSLEVSTPPYRVNQSTMYRTLSSSRHHRNCVPKKQRDKIAKRAKQAEHLNVSQLSNDSIRFNFCQEGHAIFPMSTRRHFRSKQHQYCDFCESLESINYYCKNCNKNFCTMCKHTHEMSRGSFTSYRDLMDRVFYQKTTLRHLAWRINDIKYQYENELKLASLPPQKKKK